MTDYPVTRENDRRYVHRYDPTHDVVDELTACGTWLPEDHETMGLLGGLQRAQWCEGCWS